MNNFTRTIITTGDGSKSLHMPALNEQYHSKHGALNEALHVFIQSGLAHYLRKSFDNKQPKPIRILEYGFGTGLNALLTIIHGKALNIAYAGLEAYPVTEDEIEAMDYGSLLNESSLYDHIHKTDWEKSFRIKDNFELKKIKVEFDNYLKPNSADLIYYDAFGPRTQPELWTKDIFKLCYENLDTNGILVTYCAQGQARRNMQEVGFTVERLPGPPGKREMLRASKL